MDPKELLALMEAYHDVYAPQQIDELSNRKLRAYIKKSDKSHAEINKKWDQGTATDREKYKSIGHEFGQERAFRTLDKRARKEDFEFWVDSLVEEGYDLSDYTWEEMYEAYIEEARAEGVKPYKAGPTQADVRANAAAARQKHVSGASNQTGYGPEDKFKSDWKLRATPSSTSKRKDGTIETVSQRMDREQPYKKRMTGELARKQGSRIASAVTRTIEGPGEPQAVTMPRKGRGEKPKLSREIVRKEHVDVYDVVLSHLLGEGYANSVESAEAIMVNMSEQWIESILG